MGKRYYCEYCDKSFADNPTSRRTHLTGHSHIQIRKAHYDLVRDEKEILVDDANKKPCRQFATSGQCKYGLTCQFSHLTNEDRAQLLDIINKKAHLAQAKLQEKKSCPINLKEDLDKWLDIRSKRRKLEKDEVAETTQTKTEQLLVPDYQLAECLCVFPNLPPSILPPSREEILHGNFVEWGL